MIARRRLRYFYAAAALLLAVLAAGLRLLYLEDLRREPGYAAPGIDAAYHLYWARGLATGKWEVPAGRDDPEVYRHPFYRPPGYPYFLAAVFDVFGTGPLAPRAVQMVLGAAGAFLAWALARRWFGEPAGVITGYLVGTYWIFVYFEGELVGVSLGLFIGYLLLLSLTALIRRPAPARGAVAGVCLGAYAQLRPNILVLLLPLGAWIFCFLRQFPVSRRGGIVAVFAAGTAAMMVPAAVRNYAVSGEPVLVATNAGISIGVANNPVSDGTSHVIPGIGEIGTPFDWPRIVRGMEQRLGYVPGTLTHREASGILVRQALDFIAANPGTFLRQLGRKFLLFWGPAEVRNIRELTFERARSPLLSRLPLTWAPVLAGGVLGLALIPLISPAGSAARRYGLLAAIFIGGYFLSVWPFAAAARYRVPVIPLLLILGGYALASLVRLASARNFWGAAAATAAGAGLWWLASIDWSGYEPAPEKWHADRGLAYLEAGDLAAAEAEFSEAILAAPGYGDAYCNLGVARQRAGDYSGAAEAYRKALAFKPGARAHKNLADVLAVLGRIEEARGEYLAALELDPVFAGIREDYAAFLAGTGRWDEALGEYRRAVELDPDAPLPRLRLAGALARNGKLEEAAVQYRLVLQADPSRIGVRNDLGAVLGRLGRYDQAADEYGRILAAEPDNAGAHYNLGLILRARGKNEAARGHLEQAHRSRPDLFPSPSAEEE